MNGKLRRQPTPYEREIEKEPLCPFDPLQIATCMHYKNPTDKDCRDCILTSLKEAMENDRPSNTMLHVIEYKNFMEKQMKIESQR